MYIDITGGIAMDDKAVLVELLERIQAIDIYVTDKRMGARAAGAAWAVRRIQNIIGDMLAPPPPKPCPFCGGRPTNEEPIYDGRYKMECSDCHAVGPRRQTEAEALAAWNTRKEA
jgi:Lar family restriction alleviation protein